MTKLTFLQFSDYEYDIASPLLPTHWHWVWVWHCQSTFTKWMTLILSLTLPVHFYPLADIEPKCLTASPLLPTCWHWAWVWHCQSTFTNLLTLVLSLKCLFSNALKPVIFSSYKSFSSIWERSLAASLALAQVCTLKTYVFKISFRLGKTTANLVKTGWSDYRASSGLYTPQFPAHALKILDRLAS